MIKPVISQIKCTITLIRDADRRVLKAAVYRMASINDRHFVADMPRRALWVHHCPRSERGN